MVRSTAGAGMIRFLVLGGGGFLGQAMCRYLGDRPDSVVVPYSNTISNGALDSACTSVEDLGLILAGSSVDVVVNCISATTGTVDQMLDSNVRVVARILSALSGRGELRLVQIGSAEEYGDTVVNLPVRETYLPTPVNDYGRTKLTATRLVLGAAAQGKVHATVLRVFNPVGPGAPDRTLLGRAASRIEDAQASGDNRVHLGPLSGFRDFVDVRDVAAAVVAAGTSPHASGALLNVGHGEAVQRRALVDLISAEAGFDGEIVEDADAPTRSTHIGWQQADITAIRRRLGWTPTFSLAESVHAAWAARGKPCRHCVDDFERSAGRSRLEPCSADGTEPTGHSAHHT